MKSSSFLVLCLSLLTIFSVNGHQCEGHRVQLQVLGSGGPELDDGRASSGYLVWLDGKSRVMVDTGPGTSVEFGKSKAQFAHLQGVLFSHLHADHSGDFPAFIKGSFFTERQNHLHVLGPDKGWKMPSTSAFVRRLFDQQGAFAYLHGHVDKEESGDYRIITQDVNLEKGKVSEFAISEQIKVSGIPVHHGPVPAIAWKVELAGCSLTFSGDMSNEYGVLADFAKGTNILVMHNAVPEHAGHIAKSLHMTPSEIGQIAKRAEARKLVLSHFMKRTADTDATKTQIQRFYQGPMALAEDGQVYSLDTQ